MYCYGRYFRDDDGNMSFIIFQAVMAKSKVCLEECEFRDIGMEK